MGYIGNTPTTSLFVNDSFNGTGSQTVFTLTYAPFSITSILVSVNGLIIAPLSTNYTLNGAQLTFASAPASGTNNVNVRHLGTPAVPA